jgi:hypothetical protein
VNALLCEGASKVVIAIDDDEKTFSGFANVINAMRAVHI